MKLAVAILEFIVKAAGFAAFYLFAKEREKGKQREAENVEVKKEAEDWANRPRSDNDVIVSLRDAARKRKDRP